MTHLTLYCNCSRETLETLAVLVDGLAGLLVLPSVQHGEFARDTVADGIVEQRELIAELLALADGVESDAVPDGEEVISVDRDVLRMACYGILHAYRCHEDGRETRFEERPYDTLITMLVILWELVGLETDEACDLARTRVEQRAYFQRVPPAGEAPEGQAPVSIRISADYLGDYARHLQMDAEAMARRRVPACLVSLCFRELIRMNDGLETHVREYCTRPTHFLVSNARQVAVADLRRWTSRCREAVKDQCARTLAQIASDVRGAMEGG